MKTKLTKKEIEFLIFLELTLIPDLKVAQPETAKDLWKCTQIIRKLLEDKK